MTRREHLKYGLVICTVIVIVTTGVVGINLASGQEKLTREEAIWPVANKCLRLRQYMEDPELIMQCEEIVKEWSMLWRLKKASESEDDKNSIMLELNKLNSKQE